MSDFIEINGHQIKRGESARIELEVVNQTNLNPVKMTVFVERANEDGPILLLTAGVHGDETNGVGIIRDIIRKGYHKPKAGTIICIPIVNIFGFLNGTRGLPDGRDLNRVIPGSPNGSLTSQLAYLYIHEIAHIPDYIIDFHAGGKELVNHPNIRCHFSQSQNLELAKIFDAPFTVHSEYIPKSIRAYYDSHGKTTLLYEGGKSLELDQSVIDIGVRGALNVMQHLGLQDGLPEKKYNTKFLKGSSWLRSPSSGMFQSVIANGTEIKKGGTMGVITGPFGEFEKNVQAPFDLYVFGINTAPIIFKGDPLFHICPSVLQ